MRTTAFLTVGLCLCFVAPARSGSNKAVADPQLIAAEECFFIPYPEISQSTAGQIMLGSPSDEPSEYPGMKSFWVKSQNRTFSSRTYFRTRMARPQDLVLGRRVIYPLSEIKTENDKLEAGWGYRHIIDLVDAPKGRAIVTGSSNREVELAILRVIIGGDSDPPITMSGKEDAHHFHPEHWLVFTEARQPDADGNDTKMALAIRPPAKPGDEGVFFMLNSGAIITTKHAYKTHVAKRGELKTGTRIALFTAGSDVPERHLAYRETWWVGPLTDVQPAFIKVGRSTVRAELLRVVE